MTCQPGNEPKGTPITRAEACRIAREVTEHAECRRAETAEREAQAFHEQSPRKIIEEFLGFLGTKHIRLAWITVNSQGFGLRSMAPEECSILLDDFEKQKEN